MTGTDEATWRRDHAGPLRVLLTCIGMAIGQTMEPHSRDPGRAAAVSVQLTVRAPSLLAPHPKADSLSRREDGHLAMYRWPNRYRPQLATNYMAQIMQQPLLLESSV
jgi:hypothetical protein